MRSEIGHRGPGAWLRGVALAVAPAIVLSACGAGPESPDTRGPRVEPPPGRWRQAPGGEPESSRVAEATRERLLSLGYVQGSREGTGISGVRIHDPERVQAGVNLYSSGHAPAAYLVDLQGDELHRWQVEIDRVWPGYEPTEETGEHHLFWRRVEPGADGELWAMFEGIGLVRLGRDSEVLWAERGGFHHEMRLGPDGRLHLLSRRSVIDPRINARAQILEDLIVVKDPTTGETMREISLVDAFFESDYAPVMADVRERSGDIFHTNTLVVLDGSLADILPAFREGNYLISVRELDVVAVVDHETEQVVWALRSMWRRQHDPEPLPGGRLLVFDNHGRAGASRVIELDLLTQQVEWRFNSDPRHDFFSETCGTVQRLSNGNTLITETDVGHALEVTRSGEIVWELLSPHRAGDEGQFVASLFELERLDPALFGSVRD